MAGYRKVAEPCVHAYLVISATKRALMASSSSTPICISCCICKAYHSKGRFIAVQAVSCAGRQAHCIGTPLL